ncbi:MAG: CoA ester lyase [Candidatus Thiodiazotropha sp.]
MHSLLFVPGNVQRMLDKALTCSPDAYVPDLEDSVPEGEKVNARRMVAAHLARLSARDIPVIPRINAYRTPWCEGDLAALVGPNVHGVSIGKIESAEDIAAISDAIAEQERRAGVEVGTIRLLPWIETALAVVNCYQICRASSRITAVAFGAEDLTDDLGIERTEGESETAYARSAVCIAARAAGLDALDTPYFHFRDNEGLKASVVAAKQLGFKGKFAIHPAQLELLKEMFSPSEEELAYARRVVEVFEEAEREGRGSTSLQGKVIDVPVVKRARSLLRSAKHTA